MQATVAALASQAQGFGARPGLKEETQKYYMLLVDYLTYKIGRTPESSYGDRILALWEESQGLP